MAQKKVERNVFIHYNIRLRLKNMKRARNQTEKQEYCPINLDYIFAEDDPLLPWLENREKEKEAANIEEENYPELVRRTTDTRQKTIIEVEENSSSATESDHRGGSGDDDDGGGDGDSGGPGGEGGTTTGGEWHGGASESFVPSTYPYPYTSQSEGTSGDRRKSPIIQEEEDEDEEAEDNSLGRQSPWPTGYPNVYAQAFPQYPPLQQSSSSSREENSYTYLFGYPPQYGYGYGQFQTNNNNEDDTQEPPRHSFWW